MDIESGIAELVPRLRRFAYGLCGSLHDAEDIVQDACERALTRSSQWQQGTRLDSWMFRIVQTVHLNRIRHGAVRRRYEEKERESDSNFKEGADVMEAFVTLQQVREMIWNLPEEQREVMLLVAVEGFSYKEVATTVGIPIGTVTSRLARARKFLASQFNSNAGDGNQSHLEQKICEGTL